MSSTYRCVVSVPEMTTKEIQLTKDIVLQTLNLLWAFMACNSQNRIPSLSWTSPDTYAAVFTIQLDSSLKTISPKPAQSHIDRARNHCTCF
ncbi:hypothetical protein TNCV_5049641 [Trichonephila clavipes]|nr:hypothetical protein TNCV_5049641 [Trichonephila clavipes]